MKLFQYLLSGILALGLLSAAEAQYSPTGNNGSRVLIASAVSSKLYEWPGGIGVFSAAGTWNGATVTLQFLGPDGVTLLTAGASTTFTANGAGIFYLPKCLIQATITNAGGSTSLSVGAALVPTSAR